MTRDRRFLLRSILARGMPEQNIVKIGEGAEND